MGSMVSKAILRSIDALKNRDLDLARQIIADDQKINDKRFEIEEKCIELIATQQPMASDLRIIVAVLNIIIEVERIGDYAVGIAKIVIMIGDEPPLKPLIDIPRMAEQTVDMLRRSLDAFVNRDAEAARKIAPRMTWWTISTTRCSVSCLPSWPKTPRRLPGPPV